MRDAVAVARVQALVLAKAQAQVGALWLTAETKTRLEWKSTISMGWVKPATILYQ